MSISRSFNIILESVPKSDQTVDWKKLEGSELSDILYKMSNTPQDPLYHAEGNVYAHTKAVVECLIRDELYKSSSDEDKAILFLASLFHDIGKIRCTRTEDNRIVSPHHSAVGALMTRELLWKRFSLCGSEKARDLRESICFLVRYHSFPPFAAKDSDAERKILKIAANQSLANGFSMRKLCALERADVLGRMSCDSDDYPERIEYCRMLSEELGCLDSPYPFSDDHSKRAFFLGKTDWKEQKLFDSTWGEVTLMSALPGTGKDTYIKEHYPALPVISLDDIRRELDISPTDAQGPVIALARERAKEHLRKKESFVWNATNITSQLRSKQIELFEQYGARVHTVFLETSLEEELRRNADRDRVVPKGVIEKMISKLETPECFESQKVSWHIV